MSAFFKNLSLLGIRCFDLRKSTGKRHEQYRGCVTSNSFSDDGLCTEVWTDAHRLMSEATDSQNLDRKEAENHDHDFYYTQIFMKNDKHVKNFQLERQMRLCYDTVLNRRVEQGSPDIRMKKNRQRVGASNTKKPDNAGGACR